MKKSPLITIFLIVFMSIFGFTIILPLLPFIAEKFGASPIEIGLLASTYSIAQFIATPFLGQLSDRFGRKKLLIISQIGSAFGFLLLAFAGNLFLIFISRLIDGITGGNISIAQAYIADITKKEDRAKGMGLISAAFGLGFIFGPVVGAVLSNFGLWLPALFAAVTSIITAIACQLFLKETVDIKLAKKSSKTKLSLFKALNKAKSKPLFYFVIIFLIFWLSSSLFQGIFALWTEKTFNFGPSQNGYLFAVNGFLAIFTQLLILPFLIKRMSEKKILIFALPFFSLGLLVLVLDGSIFLILLAILFLSISIGLSNPILQSMASKQSLEEEHGEVMGILQSAGSIGRVIGPALGGFAFAYFGKDSPFIISSILIMISVVYLFIAFKKRLV